MKHEKSPQIRAGCLRGCKSGCQIITNPNTKNNAPEIIVADISGAFSHNNTAENFKRIDNG
jgi:(2Fe-2S) ferredoxin